MITDAGEEAWVPVDPRSFLHTPEDQEDPTTRYCPIDGCGKVIPDTAALCHYHWSLLPYKVHQIFQEQYTPGRSIEDQSPAYQIALQMAINFIDEEEGRRDNDGTGQRAQWAIAVRAAGTQYTDPGRLIAQEKFLREYALSGSIRLGCLAAPVSRATVDKWLKEDEDFLTRFDTARADYKDTLKEEATRRGRDGIPRRKYVAYKGEIFEEWIEKDFSDTMLVKQLEAQIPEEYGRARDRVGNVAIPLETLQAILAAADNQETIAVNNNPPVDDLFTNDAIIDGDFEVVESKHID